MTIAQDSQELTVGAYVELFAIDARSLKDDAGNAGSAFYFTQAANTSSVVQWRTIDSDSSSASYQPIDIEASGFEISGQGALPRPKLKVANTTAAILTDVIDFYDLLGADCYRWRTLSKYLGTSPYQQHWPVDRFVFERKVSHTKYAIEWELSSPLDFAGVKVPKRPMLREVCLRTYRRYNGSSFDYTDLEENGCPYGDPTYDKAGSQYNSPSGGSDYWDALGNVVTGAANDRCGKHLSDCRLRFGETGVLPTGAFPGLATYRSY